MKTSKSIFALTIVLVFSFQLLAGSLEPSSNPAPTMKTLDEVEARIPIPGSDVAVGQFGITQSGSYYLTGDRICANIGIYVTADNVTIDLMGYSLIGLGTNGNSGIRLNGANNVEIRNGTIRNFGWRAIADFNGTVSKNNRVINIRAISNGQYGSGYDGISLPGVGHLVKNCTTAYNLGHGIIVGTACMVVGNISHNNAQQGIIVGGSSSVTGNLCYTNGAYGIFAYSYSLIDRNTCYSNTTGNLYAGANCQIGLNVAP